MSDIGLAIPERWSPAPEPFDLSTNSGTEHYWAAIHRCGRAYRRRIAEELAVAPLPDHRPDGSLGVPLCDLEIEPTFGDADAWLAAGLAKSSAAAERRLRRGTALELVGWTGDQTEGLEMWNWRLLEGPLAGRAFIHTPLGGRFGAEGALVDALIVSPREPIANDPARVDALLADLVRLAAEMKVAPEPTLPVEVRALLAEPETLKPRRLVRLIQTPSDHWSDTELRDLEARARDSADPDLVRLFQLGVSEALRRGGAGLRGNWKVGYPTNWLAWQALWRAGLGLLAPDLSAGERARLGEGWQRVKARANRLSPW